MRAVIRLLVIAMLVVAFVASTPHTSSAAQPDAPFLDLQAKHADSWANEDQQADEKLKALRDKHGKAPNIIYILSDDVGWGELGCYLGGDMMGRPTPHIDYMADEGIMFRQHYSEPSCTPTRLALMTGRHPVRTGCNTVLWPGGPEHLGLHPDEVTIAEVLSEAGYHTAMWGKWHLGDTEAMAPENQGFDYAHYGLFNGAIWFWLDVESHYRGHDTVTGAHPFHDFPGVEAYKERYGIDIASNGYFLGKKGEGRKVVKKLTSSKDMEDFEETSINEICDYIDEKSKSDRPFFIYWPTYFHQDAASPKAARMDAGVDIVNNQAAQAWQHDRHIARLLAKLKEADIEENTLVLWVSDNGPMQYFWPNGGYSWLRGGKGDVLEGGVRTPGIAYWPGMIDAHQKPIGMIHVVDFFTTAARLGDAMQHVPDDRITDGIDQTAYLLGIGESRRNYIFHYSGAKLGAVRWGNLKMHYGEEKGGIPEFKLYNIMRDPREEHGDDMQGTMLSMNIPFQHFVRKHLAMKKEFPDRVLKPDDDE